MSCGRSPTCNSVKLSNADLLPSPGLRWDWKKPLMSLTRMTRRWERGRQIRDLDDRLLADIGLSKPVQEVRRSPLYRDAWRDSH